MHFFPLSREISHNDKIALSGKSQSLSLISLISGQKAGGLVSLIFFLFIIALVLQCSVSCFKISHWKQCALISSRLAEALRLNLCFSCLELNLIQQQETTGSLGTFALQDLTRDLVRSYWGNSPCCMQKRARMHNYIQLLPIHPPPPSFCLGCLTLSWILPAHHTKQLCWAPPEAGSCRASGREVLMAGM